MSFQNQFRLMLDIVEPDCRVDEKKSMLLGYGVKVNYAWRTFAYVFLYICNENIYKVSHAYAFSMTSLSFKCSQNISLADDVKTYSVSSC